MAHYENNYWEYESPNINYFETPYNYSEFQNITPAYHIETYSYPSLDTQSNFQPFTPQQQLYSEDPLEKNIKIDKRNFRRK